MRCVELRMDGSTVCEMCRVKNGSTVWEMCRVEDDSTGCEMCRVKEGWTIGEICRIEDGLDDLANVEIWYRVCEARN